MVGFGRLQGGRTIPLSSVRERPTPASTRLDQAGRSRGSGTAGQHRLLAWRYYAYRSASRTVFFGPVPYQLISFVRRWAYDALALAPAIAVGVWWVTATGGTSMPPGLVATAGSTQLFLLSHHVARFYPTLIALLLCLIIVRVGRTGRLQKSPVKVAVTARMPLGIVVFLAGLALIDLILVPGPILERAVPVLAAPAWAWLIRSQVYGRIRVLEGSGAGFRPPARILASRSARRLAANCLTTTWRRRTMDEARAGLQAAWDHFAAGSDVARCRRGASPARWTTTSA